MPLHPIEDWIAVEGNKNKYQGKKKSFFNLIVHVIEEGGGCL